MRITAVRVAADTRHA